MLDLIKKSASFSLGLIIFYFIGTMLSIANYVSYFRYHEERYGKDLVNACLAFTVLGTITYALFSALCWVWAFKYVEDANDRLTKIGYGMFGIFLMHDCPLFIIQFHAYLCCGGTHHGLQGTVFVVQWLEFLLSFTFAWQSYAWQMAGLWNSLSGEATGGYNGGPSVGGGTLKTGSERIDVLPPPGTKIVDNSVPLLPVHSTRSPPRGSPRDYSPSEQDWRQRDRLPSPNRRMIPVEDPGYRGGLSRRDDFIPVDRQYNVNQPSSYQPPHLPEMDRGTMMNASPMQGNYDQAAYSDTGSYGGGHGGGGGSGYGGYSPGVIPPLPAKGGGSIYMERGLL